jgi:Cu/Ag efflux pump CusA
MASKNAILMVEFAKDLHEKGKNVVDAAREAARLRLRPILMTALSFILGIVPLVVATGAGAASRQSLGTAVFGGMVAATFLSLVMVPVIYVIIQTLAERGLKRSDPKAIVQLIRDWWKRFEERMRVRKEEIEKEEVRE